ncbi:ImmA/IrrE family metallo-endopeptidase [Streptococcus parauberis]|uniref:ImmA/IrrE family metallo-endopeptidase n=1 Tax=Streptococcus parauberis TaxID=1348 RepID=A0AAE4HYT1_9STRE|nr:ImmA/IrrE family metallo-endopeptidase [Streptococcus parauberis]MDT2732543.1 ImmA/IrrE family metallo-endopeptidase [Streptococcus parauberis]
MSELYTKIWKQAHQEIYSFIKMTKMKAENYTFEDYFNYIVEKNNIKVMPHHFENDLILGITMIDKLGTSISYESSNIETRQNFTKCHELGHLVLKHNGGVFTELQKNHTPIEIEADFFASIIMAPDIVLLYKILYQQASYRQLIQDLKISNQALTIRLSYFLQTYSTKTKNDIHEIIDNYKRLTNSKNLIIDLLIESKDFIIRNYQNILIDETELIDYYIDKYEFFTSQDLPILCEKHIQNTLKQKYPNYSTWAYFDKGKTTWYTWNKTKYSHEIAYNKAKSVHILKQIKTSK